MKTALCLTLLTLAAALSLPVPAVAARGKVTEEDRTWWSFQPVTDPSPPEVGNATWSQSPVDRFIMAELEKAGLPPALEAPKSVLVRRLYFDLLGLPPSRGDVETFVADTAPDAWERLVDKILASPRYGERQARLWLDLVRFAESDGYKADAFRPDAWRFRDYVIDAFNSDKPYDRFIREQIAGDELFPGDPQALIATGYLRHWIYEYNNRDVEGQWSVILNDVTDTTADVFMGLGLQCARCHDHKFDPLLQKDYYRLQAFFAGMEPKDGTAILSSEKQAERQAGQEAWEQATADILRQIEEVRAPVKAKAEKTALDLFPPETQAILAMPETERSPHQKQIATLAYDQVLFEYNQVDSRVKGEDKQKLVALRKELAAFDSLKPEPLPTASTAADVGPVAPPTIIPRRESEGDILPGIPSLLDPGAAEVNPLRSSTGRRSALAAWLASPANPLTARVMVNRVWQQHFGRGLCSTTSDFGHLGDKPSHPELLDWLAHRFMEDGWSLKKLHRIILTSHAWRQSHVSTAAEQAKLTDHSNRLVWRWTTRRLEAEQIRDAVFAATGELDLAETGGPSVDSGKPRRTIYTKVLRNTRDPLTDVFDAPQNFNSTPSRDTTTTATQSLFLANSRFMSGRAEAMARDLSQHFETDADRVEAAWWRTTGRAPTTDERGESLAFLTSQSGGGSPVLSDDAASISESMPQRYGKAAVLIPGTSQERLAVESPPLPDGDFTVESVVLLHSVQEDGNLRTIAGQWSGDKTQSGWALGVTGKKSQRKPFMPVLQLIGPGADGAMVYEPVFSDFQMEMDRSYYVSVAVHPATSAGPGTVTFRLKDLANDDLPMLTSTVPHPVAAISPPPGPLYIGAAGPSKNHLWDGLVDEIRISRGLLAEEETALRHPAGSPSLMAAWKFEPDPGFRVESVSGMDSIRPSSASLAPVPRESVLADFCQAMLSSSALLYLE